MPSQRTPDIAAGRLSPEEYALQFRRPASAARPARGAGRSRPLLFLLRRALHAGLPDLDRHSAVHPPDRDRQSDRLGEDDPRRRTSWAACAPASARPRRCARRPACARSPRASRSQIGRLQRYATDALMAEGKPALSRAPPPTGKRVAVVGAGPAGLACAHRLAMHGHDVTIFEARPKAGRPQRIRHRRLQDGRRFRAGRSRLHPRRSAASTIEHGKALGRDFTLADLRRDYDAVFLGMGLGGVNALRADGEECSTASTNAVDFIAELRQASDLAALPVGRRVVVIGGGMTAIDIAVQIEAARRRGGDHRLPPRPGADERLRVRAGARARPTAS